MDERAIFDTIRAGIEQLTIDEIKARVRPLLDGMVSTAIGIDTGTFLYRARLRSSNFPPLDQVTLRDLSYPLPAHTFLNRANRENDPLFYCSVAREPLYYEFPGLAAGDELVVSNWQSIGQGWLHSIGYTQTVFDRLGAKRRCPSWNLDRKPLPNDQQAEVILPDMRREAIKAAASVDPNGPMQQLLSEQFCSEVGASSRAQYKLTVAIAEILLDPIAQHDTGFSGIAYPSMRMSANADNIALRPWFVDKHLEFKRAHRIRIDNRDGAEIKFTYLDTAKSVDNDGRLQWHGRERHWSIPPLSEARAVFEPGPDADGDYAISLQGNKCHWELYDKQGKRMDLI